MKDLTDIDTEILVKELEKRNWTLEFGYAVKADLEKDYKPKIEQLESRHHDILDRVNKMYEAQKIGSNIDDQLDRLYWYLIGKMI